MPGAALTRRVRFAATHRYHRPDWDDIRNHATFGACAAAEPHGHDYTCDVTIAGDVEPATGMVADLGVLDRVLAQEVVGRLDGRCVNDALPEFAPGRRIPTCEELAHVIAVRVADALAHAGARARVASVRVAEDDTLWATWTTGG
ncbi:MAG TPA: 6-carboxytetrahydropterin synthase [Gemmatimonadaceae bacterium]|nr:6-carboxytetrahydropterin synthase [Gemmatimonadaceae bacterium]